MGSSSVPVTAALANRLLGWTEIANTHTGVVRLIHTAVALTNRAPYRFACTYSYMHGRGREGDRQGGRGGRGRERKRERETERELN